MEWVVGQITDEGDWTYNRQGPSFKNKQRCQKFIDEIMIPPRKEWNDSVIWHTLFKPINPNICSSCGAELPLEDNG